MGGWSRVIANVVPPSGHCGAEVLGLSGADDQAAGHPILDTPQVILPVGERRLVVDDERHRHDGVREQELRALVPGEPICPPTDATSNSSASASTSWPAKPWERIFTNPSAGPADGHGWRPAMHQGARALLRHGPVIQAGYAVGGTVQDLFHNAL